MKTKLLIIISMLNWAFVVSSDDAKSNSQTMAKSERFEIIVDIEDGEVTKKIIVNGKELSDEEIREFEASGKMKILHMDSSYLSKSSNNVFMVKGDVSGHGGNHMVNKLVTKSGAGDEDVQVFIEQEGDKTTERIIVNGEQLSDEEIEEFKASGKMKVISVTSDMVVVDGNKRIFINSDSEHGSDIDIEVIMDKIGDLQGLHHDNSTIKEWISEDGKNIKIISKSKGVFIKDDNSASLGFMANIEDDGWHLTRIMDKSGAKDAGIMVGDVVTKIGNSKLIRNPDSEKREFNSLPRFEDGDVVKVTLKRDGAPITFDVQARKLDKSEMLKKMLSMQNNGKKIHIKDGVDLNVVNDYIFKDVKLSLGFMTMKQSDGMHVGYILDGSGAKDSGLQQGDHIIRIGEIEFKESNVDDANKELSLVKREVGEQVEVVIKRGEEIMDFLVEVKKSDFSQVMSENPPKDFFHWLDTVKDHEDVLANIKVMVFNGKDGDFKLNKENIHMVFPEKLGKMNFFISDGKSTSKLLGKHHEMSAMSGGLSKYFNTTGGVLVLHVDDSNAFNLQDGDVIKSINNNKVNSPKEVVKQLINVDKQENIKMKVVRNKKSKTLKYEK